MLKIGSKGTEVSEMKRRLKAHGFWGPWPINNGFGKITDRQVRKFQAARNLEVDGIVGPSTWASLNQPGYAKSKGERAAAVRWALSKNGVNEQPAYSNRGPGKDGITAMQEASGYPGGGVPWCQCFASYSAQVGTRGRLKAAWFGGYTVGVVSMARAGERGLRLIKLEAARPGDWIEFNFPGGESVDHVGVFLSYDRTNGTVTCIEGNTSPGSGGSQANGGGAYKRTRDIGLVGAVVQVPFKS